jgi:hypothetical protein
MYTGVVDENVIEPVPAFTFSSNVRVTAVLGGNIPVPVLGNTPVTAAGVPVVACKGPVLSVPATTVCSV